jgi:site-specific recombinase XerD
MKTIEQVLEAFELAALKAGLRHSYASGLLSDGVDVKVIQEQLGHTSLETTCLYLHTTGKRTVASPLDRVIPFPISKTA